MLRNIFLIVLGSTSFCHALAEELVHSAPVPESVAAPDIGTALVQACSRLALSDKVKAAVSKAANEADADAQKAHCDKQETARRVLKAVGDTLEASGVKGIAEKINKLGQEKIEIATSAAKKPDAKSGANSQAKPTGAPKSATNTRKRRSSADGEWEDDVDYF